MGSFGIDWYISPLVSMYGTLLGPVNTWREGAPANRATQGGLTSHMFLLKTHQSVNMLARVARLPGAPCLLVRATRQGGVAFYCVNGLCWVIPANRGEINRENMAA